MHFWSPYSLLLIVLRQSLPRNAFFVTIQPSLDSHKSKPAKKYVFWSGLRRRNLCCGKTRSLLWQDKMCVVARQDLCCGKTRSLMWQEMQQSTKGGGAKRRPPLWRRPKAASFVGVGFCVFWAVGLHIRVVGAFLDTIALPAE